LFVAFILAFVVVVGFSISNMSNDAQLPKYTKVGMLSDRMDTEIRLIGNLVKPDEKIAVHEHNLYGSYLGESFYDGNGGWLLEQEYYCSKNISDKVEEISRQTGIYDYSGPKDYTIGGSLEDFKKYLLKVNANCVDVRKLDPSDQIGNVKTVLGWGLEADGMAVWQESLIKSIFAVLQTLFFIAIGSLVLLVLYYKVFLYIVFGRWRNDKDKN